MSASKEDEKLECVSDQERDLAQQAYSDFQVKNYNGCLQNLAKLDNKKDDFKVMHNKFITEYYKGDCKKTNALLKNLYGLLGKFGLHIDRLEDVEYCVAYFNFGIVYYQVGQYTKALKIIERIYKFIEPLDETLGQQVGLLLVELHLCVRQVEKALSLITYFQNQTETQVASKAKDDKVELKIKSDNDFLKMLERYRIKCNLLMHSLKSASADIKILHDENADDIEVLYLLANQQYLEGNFQDAMQTMGKVPANALKYLSSGESSNVIFYNNLGVIHHAMGKPNLACHYFNQALHEEPKISVDCPLHMLGALKYHEIMFNMGISLLYAGKSAQAFDCLIVAVRKYHRNCRLWLRLAECCIQQHKPSNTVDFDIQRKQKELVVDVLGSKETQKVILNTNLTTDKKYSADSQSYAVPVATLEFATLCLKNAEFVLDSDATSSAEPLLLIPGVSLLTSTSSSISSPSSPIQPDDKTHLRNSILAASAYVSLCLGDYVAALAKATELLQQPKMSGAHKLLGHLYSVECLVLQDRLKEALEHLNPEMIKDISLDCPGDDLDDEIPTQTCPPTVWFPNKLPSAIAVMQYNLAVIMTIRGQFEQAAKLLNQVWQSRTPENKVPAQIIMLVLYIKIQQGHVDVAKNFIRQYSIQRRIAG